MTYRDEGLGAAMGLDHAERLARKATEEQANLAGRVAELERTVATLIGKRDGDAVPANIAAQLGPSEYFMTLRHFGAEIDQSRDVVVIQTHRLHELIEAARFGAILGYAAATERG